MSEREFPATPVPENIKYVIEYVIKPNPPVVTERVAKRSCEKRTANNGYLSFPLNDLLISSREPRHLGTVSSGKPVVCGSDLPYIDDTLLGYGLKPQFFIPATWVLVGFDRSVPCFLHHNAGCHCRREIFLITA